ncbi:hypothetical protein POTOM_052368 [Populus tomentosa]|uniref:TFIIS N-terminal domain-containing protein n=1 Tax=Populus tomentosa TaxID=118781 RepID=A0A8X7Y687_POPTO|nr:hypothetical protein POTOM_052368 [Populus tomentosa]
MEKQFLFLFESAKKSAAIVATSASIFPEVYRCLDALDQLKRFPVTSSRVLVSTPVAKEAQYLTKHRVKMIRTAASCLLDAWSRNLYARNSVIGGKTQPTKSTSGSRTGTLIVKIHGRAIRRVKVNMPIQTENKIKEEKESGFSCFKKPPQEPAKRCTKPGKVQSTRRCFKKPSTKRITQQENVKDFCSFKKPSEELVKCSDDLRRKVKAHSCGVTEKILQGDVESVMFEKMGPFNGTKQLKHRSMLFNMKDPKNPDLWRKVLLGKIKPEKLVTMTAEEMASNQRQFENDQIRKKSLWKEMNAEQEHKSVDPMEYCGHCCL